jgi:hypothetical protein
MRKVELKVIRPWVTKKVVELVGFEDEVVVEYAMGLLEDESQPVSADSLHKISRISPVSPSRPPTQRRCKSI